MKNEKFLSYLVIFAGILCAVILGIRSWNTEQARKVDAPDTAKTQKVTVAGFGGDMTLEVTADAEKLYGVNVLSNSETQGIGSKAVEALPALMVEQQSFNVDGISGATVSSTALRTGVEQAIKEMGFSTDKFSTPSGGSSKAEPEKDRNLEADVVVIGAGGAGMISAITAADLGKSVVILESQAMVGGNSIRATGGMNAAATKWQNENPFEEGAGVEKTLATAAEKYSDNETITALAAKVKEQYAAYQANPEGYFDSVELMELDTMVGGKGKNNPTLVKVLAEQSGPAIDYLEKLGMTIHNVGSFGGASVKRIHRPVDENGKVIAVGSYMIPILEENLKKRDKITLLTSVTAEEITKSEDGKISGVKAKGSSGNSVEVKAPVVIVATGGFAANKEMVEKYQPSLKGYMSTNAPGALGQGITMAEAVGADTVDMDQIQIHPTVTTTDAHLITEGLRGDGAILVNQEGLRFTDEVGTRDAVSKAEIEQTNS